MGNGFFSYESRLVRFIDSEVRKASGIRWYDAVPGTPNSVLFGAGFNFSQIFFRFRLEGRPFPAAALLVITGAAADRLVEIADHVTRKDWSEDDGDPKLTIKLADRLKACVQTGMRLKDDVDPLEGKRAFLKSMMRIAISTGDRRYSERDFDNTLKAARRGIPFPAHEIEGDLDEEERELLD